MNFLFETLLQKEYICHVNKKRSAQLSILGTSASLLCAIHCLSLPILLSAGALGLSNLFTNPLVEFSLISISVIFGILVISSHLAHKNLNESYVDETHVKLREAIFYSWSSVTSLFSCYVMAIFFLHARVIFSPTVSPQGELETIIQRWLDQSYVPMYFWVILLLVLVFVRFWREQIGSLAKP